MTPVPLGRAADGQLLADVEAAIEGMPVERREALARRYFSPSALRRRREQERDDLIRCFARDQAIGASGRKLSEAVAAALSLYASGPWKFERDKPVPTDPGHALLWRILHLNRGRLLSEPSVRRILAGLAKLPGRLAQNQCRF